MIYGAISLPENKGDSLVKTEDKLTNLAGETNPAGPGDPVKL
mgnify:CR=1 FL=1